MLGRIRASSSLESLEGSPSKLLKHDSFSIYEATLMKLKLGAQRDISASSIETDEIIINDSSISSPCVEESNVKPNRSPPPASASSSQHIGGIMMMETDCSCITLSPSFSDHVSTGNSQQPRHNNNVSILHFFSRHTCISSSSCGEPTSTKSGCSGSISSSSIESHYASEMESIPSSQDCQLSE